MDKKDEISEKEAKPEKNKEISFRDYKNKMITSERDK
jgi:hypothetical protein